MKVSVIMLTSCRPELLVRAIDSYIAQDYSDKELIIVSNNPCEATKKILQRICALKDIKVFFDYTPFSPGKLFNQAWNASMGDLVCHLHDDDEMFADSLSVRVKEFEKNPFTEVVWGGVVLQDIDGNLGQRLPGEAPNTFRMLNLCDTK